MSLYFFLLKPSSFLDLGVFHLIIKLGATKKWEKSHMWEKMSQGRKTILRKAVENRRNRAEYAKLAKSVKEIRQKKLVQELGLQPTQNTGQTESEEQKTQPMPSIQENLFSPHELGLLL